ncbi:MAG: hypothetical protein AAF699_20165 [Pseudomonadota bacterium]
MIMKDEHTASTEPFQTVKRFFELLSVRDISGVEDITTNEFVLLEHGQAWNRERLIQAIQGDYQRRNFFSMHREHTENKAAWVAYWNRAVLSHANGDSQNYYWLESALLQHSDGRWRLSLLHSTRITSEQLPNNIQLIEYRVRR